MEVRREGKDERTAMPTTACLGTTCQQALAISPAQNGECLKEGVTVQMVVCSEQRALLQCNRHASAVLPTLTGSQSPPIQPPT